jgi:hypothetical protein
MSLLANVQKDKKSQHYTLAIHRYIGKCLKRRKSQLYALLHCKKRLAVFPSPAGMPLTKLSLAENNQIISWQGEFG